MNQVQIENLVRVSKPTALRKWKAGERIRIQSCNLYPDNPWQPAIPLTGPDALDEQYNSVDELNKIFDHVVNAFEWCNCGDSERGRYAAFYMEV